MTRGDGRRATCAAARAMGLEDLRHGRRSRLESASAYRLPAMAAQRANVPHAPTLLRASAFDAATAYRNAFEVRLDDDNAAPQCTGSAWEPW
jgi:hypothetical protein